MNHVNKKRRATMMWLTIMILRSPNFLAIAIIGQLVFQWRSDLPQSIGGSRFEGIEGFSTALFSSKGRAVVLDGDFYQDWLCLRQILLHRCPSIVRDWPCLKGYERNIGAEHAGAKSPQLLHRVWNERISASPATREKCGANPDWCGTGTMGQGQKEWIASLLWMNTTSSLGKVHCYLITSQIR